MDDDDDSTIGEDFDLLGISVEYLQNDFMNEVKRAGFNEKSKIYELENLNDFDNNGVIRRKGEKIICPIDNKLGAAYVHAIGDQNAVNKADIMLSYAWEYTIGDIIDTLIGYCEETKEIPKDVYVWICCLCVNQHRVVEMKKNGSTSSFKRFKAVVEGRVVKIGYILAMVAPWHAPTYLTRLWCIFEVFITIKNKCKMTIVMPSKERKEFIDCMNRNDGYEQMNRLLTSIANVNITNAEATEESDRQNILAFIESQIAYDTFNKTVSTFMKQWALDIIDIEVEGGRHGAGDHDSEVKHGQLLNNVAKLFHEIDICDKSLAVSKEALSVNESVYGRESKECATSLGVVGLALFDMDRKTEGTKLLLESLEIRKKVLGLNHEDTIESITLIAYALNDEGKKDEATEKYKEALDLYEKLFGREHEKIEKLLYLIATILKEKGELDEAEKLFNEVLQIQEQTCGGQHERTAETMGMIAGILEEKKNLEEALVMRENALSIFDKVYGRENKVTAKAIHDVGATLCVIGRSHEALDMFREALRVEEKVLEKDHPGIANTESWITNIMNELDVSWTYSDASKKD